MNTKVLSQQVAISREATFFHAFIKQTWITANERSWEGSPVGTPHEENSAPSIEQNCPTPWLWAWINKEPCGYHAAAYMEISPFFFFFNFGRYTFLYFDSINLGGQSTKMEQTVPLLNSRGRKHHRHRILNKKQIWILIIVLTNFLKIQRTFVISKNVNNIWTQCQECVKNDVLTWGQMGRWLLFLHLQKHRKLFTATEKRLI